MLKGQKIVKIRNAILAGWGQRRIATELKVSYETVVKYRRVLGLNKQRWTSGQPSLEPAIVEALRELRNAGLPKRAIARRLEIDRRTVDRYLRDESVPPVCACGHHLAGHPGFCHDLYPRRMVRENAKLKWEAA